MIRLCSARGLLPLAVLLLVAGCDSAGGRQEISGMVTLKGQPVDEGVIEFHPLDSSSPDQLVTKSGAMITDGKYVIRKDQGLVPGKYRVIISSGDKKAPPVDDGGPGPKNIFSKERIPADYNVETKQVVDVKKEGSNKFDYLIP